MVDGRNVFIIFYQKYDLSKFSCPITFGHTFGLEATFFSFCHEFCATYYNFGKMLFNPVQTSWIESHGNMTYFYCLQPYVLLKTFKDTCETYPK